PSQCGGPLVGLQGKALGLNIARAGRVVSYAVPSDVVVGLLSDLKSGKLAPSAALLATLTPPRGPLEAPVPKAEPVQKDKPSTPRSINSSASCRLTSAALSRCRRISATLRRGLPGDSAWPRSARSPAVGASDFPALVAASPPAARRWARASRTSGLSRIESA